VVEVKSKMASDNRQEKIQKLKEMIREKKKEDPVEKVLVKFCARTSVSMETCEEYYRYLVDSGEIEEK
jgi:hypothetical protein